MKGKSTQMLRMPSRPVILVAVLALVVLLGISSFALRQAANATEPLEADRVSAADVRILVSAASACPTLTPARLAGQVMVASRFGDEPVGEMREGGATGVAALTPEQWRQHAPWSGAEPTDRTAAITALAHAMCQHVGQSRAVNVEEDPWRVALAAHRSGMEQVIMAGGIPDGANKYVDTVERYANWYALQPAFVGGVVTPATGVGQQGGGTVVPVPDAYLKAIVANGRVCAEMPATRIAAQIMVTSGFDPYRLGPAGEQGIAQFLPRVWAANIRPAPGRTPWDPIVAIAGLSRTMCKLIRDSGGQYAPALTAFTRGDRRAPLETALAEAVTRAESEYAKDPRLQVTPTRTPSAAPSVPAAAQPSKPATSPSVSVPVRENQPAVKAADASGQNYGPYFIVNLRNKTCVDLPNFGAGKRDGPVRQYSCAKDREDNQEWRFEPRSVDGDGYQLYWIRNIDDGFCIDPPGLGTISSGTPINETGCFDKDNQYFRLEPRSVSGGLQYYWLRNKVTDLCLDIPGVADTRADLQLTLFTCRAGDDHEWALVQKSEW